MNDQQVYEQMSGTSLLPANQAAAPEASNEGLLRQVRAIGNVAREASRSCLKGKAAAQEMKTRKNGPGQ